MTNHNLLLQFLSTYPTNHACKAEQRMKQHITCLYLCFSMVRSSDAPYLGNIGRFIFIMLFIAHAKLKAIHVVRVGGSQEQSEYIRIAV